MLIPILDAQTDGDQIETLPQAVDQAALLEGLDDADGESKIDVVRRILRDVQEQGDLAVLKYTLQFDRVELPADRMRVGQEEIDAALAATPAALLRALDVAIENLRTYQQAMLPADPPPIAVPGGGKRRIWACVTLRSSVGLYVPGGAAAYPSSVLMTAIPARVGRGRKSSCSARRCAKDMFPLPCWRPRRGWAWQRRFTASAAPRPSRRWRLALIRFGRSIKFGPGNAFVQLAKKKLYGIVDIDSFASHRKWWCWQNDSADAAQVAAMLAQAGTRRAIAC